MAKKTWLKRTTAQKYIFGGVFLLLTVLLLSFVLSANQLEGKYMIKYDDESVTIYKGIQT